MTAVAAEYVGGEQRHSPPPTAVKRQLATPPPSSTKLAAHDALRDGSTHDSFADDRGSTTSKAESSANLAGFAEAYCNDAPLSPPSSSTHSRGSTAPTTARSAAEAMPSSSSSKTPLRPAYLYVDGEESVPPEEPTDDIKGVPVFTPTWEEFQDFYSYCSRIDEWGMHSGIVKIIPPKEWTGALPSLDGRQGERVGERYTDAHRLSQVRIKNSIEQLFTPAGLGVWRQSNVVHPARVINAKQWADVCASKDQRGPEMKRMLDVARRKKDDVDEDGVRTRSGRGRGGAAAAPSANATSSTAAKKVEQPRPSTPAAAAADEDQRGGDSNDSIASRRTLSPRKSAEKAKAAVSSLSTSAAAAVVAVPTAPTHNKPKMAERTTQEEWNAFDYRNDWRKEAGDEAQTDDWAMDTCRAIENEYWRGLNYGKPPMYGADLSGTLFTPETRSWNVGALDNILTRLRMKRRLPGVTTPYLYFGMWRATFAWHVEDMDLYSINYIHFGAPKQWYSIRQADKQRFELAMASAFPADSGRCRHFMRHKSYLASPAFIESAAGKIKPLRVVQKAQEIVLTYPYGYHSGYNLGYNCAESVNFALERWLDIGRKATYCECTNDSVKMDVDAMLEESEELVELERKRSERERKREDEDALQRTEEDKAEERRAKERERRKRRKEEMLTRQDKVGPDSDEPAAKKVKTDDTFPCELCPSLLREDLIVISDETGDKKVKQAPRRAHRLCASFIPETWVAPNPKAENTGPHSRIPKELVMGFDGIAKARWSLKCQTCQDPALSKRGAKVQCTFGRCWRTSHVSCALMEENGWMLDVLPDSEADALEGKTSNGKDRGGKGRKSKGGSSRKSVASTTTAAEEEAGDEEGTPRMVVLCRLHNPVEREREAKRKAAVLQVCLEGLEKGQKVCVRTGTGLWETIFESFTANADDGSVTLVDGSEVKGSKVVFDAETIQKADDVVWYREEAEVLREQKEEELGISVAAAAPIATVGSAVEAEPMQPILTKEEQQRQREEARQVKAAEQAAKKAERQRKAAEKGQKKKERDEAKAVRSAAKEAKIAGPLVTPALPPQSAPPRSDALQYIREWKPRDASSMLLPPMMAQPQHFGRPASSIVQQRGGGVTLPSLSSFNLQQHQQQQQSQPPQQVPAFAHPAMNQYYGTLPDRRIYYARPSYEQHGWQREQDVTPLPTHPHPAYHNVWQQYGRPGEAPPR